MPHLLGLIFDLDGTLVDSAADLRQALNALLAAHGRREITLAEVKSIIGDGLQTMLQRAFNLTEAPMPEKGQEIIFQDFLKLYQSQKASPEQLYPHVLESLASFQKAGLKIGLCTNKLYLPTLKLLDDIGITPLFDFVAGCDTFPVYKPHPGHVLGVAHAMKLPVDACVMIGDSPNDIRAAQGANMKSIAVAHGYGRDVSSLGADAVIADFTELVTALGHLGFDFVS